ncbi:unnamed protein product [Lota lota]
MPSPSQIKPYIPMRPRERGSGFPSRFTKENVPLYTPLSQGGTVAKQGAETDLSGSRRFIEIPLEAALEEVSSRASFLSFA